MNMDFAALSKLAKDATTKAKATATKLAEQAKERLEDTEGNKQMMQQFAEKVGRTLDEFIDEAPGPDQSKIIDLTYVTDRFVTMGFPAYSISASRGATVPSRHRGDSCPSHDDVGRFFLEFEAIRTVSSDTTRRAGFSSSSTTATKLPIGMSRSISWTSLLGKLEL